MIASFEHSTGNTAPEAAPDERLLRRLVWLAQLIQENGAGEYIVTFKQDGSLTVKRPRRPLEFHYAG